MCLHFRKRRGVTNIDIIVFFGCIKEHDDYKSTNTLFKKSSNFFSNSIEYSVFVMILIKILDSE